MEESGPQGKNPHMGTTACLIEALQQVKEVPRSGYRRLIVGLRLNAFAV